MCCCWISSCESQIDNQAITDFNSLIHQGKILEAEQVGKKIFAETTQDEYSENYLALLHQMANLTLVDGRVGEAEQYALKSLDVIEVLHKNPSYEHTQAVSLLGRIYYYGRALDKAIEYLQQSLALRTLEEMNMVEAADDLYLLSQSFAGFGQYKETVYCLERAYFLYEKNNTFDTTRKFEMSRALGLGYSYLGRQQEAIRFSTTAVSIAEQWKGTKSFAYAEALKGASLVNLRGRDTGSAIKQMSQAISILSTFPKQVYALLDATKYMAELYSQSRDTAQANRYYGMMMEIVDTLRPESMEALPIASPLASYGHHLLLYKHYSQSEKFLLEALSIFERELGSNNPKIVNVLNDLYTLYTSTSRHKEAQEISSKLSTIKVTPT